MCAFSQEPGSDRPRQACARLHPHCETLGERLARQGKERACWHLWSHGWYHTGKIWPLQEHHTLAPSRGTRRFHGHKEGTSSKEEFRGCTIRDNAIWQSPGPKAAHGAPLEWYHQRGSSGDGTDAMVRKRLMLRLAWQRCWEMKFCVCNSSFTD